MIDPTRSDLVTERLPVDRLIDLVRFDAQGLVPAIAQQHDSGEVLMMAWMTRDSLAETLASGRACYWSRSRNAFWRKGDTSGHVQHVVDVRVDCDGDTVLVLVDQTGAACHTGQRSCFFRGLNHDAAQATGKK